MAGAALIDGKQVAARVRAEVATEVEELARQIGRAPGLATVLVGDDPASAIYVRRKGDACREVGIESFHHELPADTHADELRELLRELNRAQAVDGILLQLPLPPQLDAAEMTGIIDPRKDVDGLTPVNAGLLAQGRPALAPCTPAGVMELLRAYEVELRGVEAVVVGRSHLVGKPLAALLLAEDATVTTCHSRTADLAAACRRADVLVAAVGVPHLVNADMVKEGAVVIDVGMNRLEDGLAGDVDFERVKDRARLITPVPGGVGPMTIAMLLVNTVAAARGARVAGAAG